MKRSLQAVDAPVIDGASADHGAHQPRQVVSPYLTSREAIVYLRLSSLSALYDHIRNNRLPVLRVGRHMRFDTRELDAWMRGFDSALTAARLCRKRA